MSAWIGPALLAALIAALVNMVGWWVAFRNNHRLDQLRREEKVRDFQIALRAEIGSELQNLDDAEKLEGHLQTIAERYRTIKDYAVHVPHMAPNMVFDTILSEIHILPGAVIAPVVDYERRRQTVARFADELRDEQFRQLPQDRQLAMYTDYLGARLKLRKLALAAAQALDEGLRDDQ